eukprot:TRINITY_DN23234_c0_g1_i1.p1 TRINITY_DN23234_c0_g1~~TRINITY_DN23234_c0_g1_i1.p1  ORF type:complete len:347 (-),score=45.67 TRINITY_DN23234_c0_g1_i1:206-1246(-)
MQAMRATYWFRRRLTLLAISSACLSDLWGSDGAQETGLWLKAIEISKEFEVVSAVSHIDELSQKRSNLLNDFPLGIRLLGLKGKSNWKNLDKISLIHEYASVQPPEKVLFVLDLYDVSWLHCGRDLLDTFRSFNKPLVFGAEISPYPLLNVTLNRLGAYPLFSSYPGDSPLSGYFGPAGKKRRYYEYRYLNAGCIAGYSWALKRATGRMISNNFDNQYVLRTKLARSARERRMLLVGKDDQTAWHTYSFYHLDEVALDYGARLFFNGFGFSVQEFQSKDGRIWSRSLKRTICFVHGNGASNLPRWLPECQKHGIQPYRCAEVEEVQGLVKTVSLNCEADAKMNHEG